MHCTVSIHILAPGNRAKTAFNTFSLTTPHPLLLSLFLFSMFFMCLCVIGSVYSPTASRRRGSSSAEINLVPVGDVAARPPLDVVIASVLAWMTSAVAYKPAIYNDLCSGYSSRAKPSQRRSRRRPRRALSCEVEYVPRHARLMALILLQAVSCLPPAFSSRRQCNQQIIETLTVFCNLHALSEAVNN